MLSKNKDKEQIASDTEQATHWNVIGAEFVYATIQLRNRKTRNRSVYAARPERTEGS